MRTCRKCGAVKNREDARFCEECGDSLDVGCAGALPEAPLPMGDDDALRGSSSAKPRTDSKDSDAYEAAVREKLAEGVLDNEDRVDLENARQRLGLSANQAGELEANVSAGLTAGAAIAGPDMPPAPIRLEINDSHFYMMNYYAVLDFRLANCTGEALKKVQLSVRGKALGQVDECHTSLDAGGQDRQYIQIEPERAGEHLVNITVSLRIDSQIQIWATQALLKVLSDKEPLQNLKMIFNQPIQGERIGYGFSIRNEVSGDIARGVIRDTNDLLAQCYSETWRTLPLTLRESQQATAIHVIPELASRGPRLAKAALVVVQGHTERRVLLLAGEQVSFGRKRTGNDIVLRRLPRSAENDRRTLQISGQHPHFTLALHPDGLYVVDQDGVNPTYVNGKVVADRIKLALERPSEVDVGEALQLRLSPFCDSPSDQPPAAERYQILAAPDELWRMSEKVGLRSLLITRADSLAEEESYLIVYRWASIAQGKENRIRPGREGADARLRVVRIGGSLWGEGTAGAPRPVVNGIAVSPGAVFPLTPGLALQLGNSTARVAEFQQIGL